MAYILAIETSTQICSAAIFKDKSLLAKKEKGGAYSHAEKLAFFIEELLKQTGLSSGDLDAIAVSKGPGSYTGLRIGVSMAKGLCYGLSIPLISIDTLKGMSFGIAKNLKKEGFLCPMIDARRMEVYTALLNFNLEFIKPVNAVVVEAEFLNSELENSLVYIFGNGAEKCLAMLKHQNVIFLENELPTAGKMGELAFQKFQKNNFEDTAYFEPFYLKEFIALKGKKLV